MSLKETEEEKTEERARIGAVEPQDKVRLGPLKAGRGKGRFSPGALGRGAAFLCLDFGILAYRILQACITEISLPARGSRRKPVDTVTVQSRGLVAA